MLAAKLCLVNGEARVLTPVDGSRFTREELSSLVGSNELRFKVIQDSGEIICCADKGAGVNKNATILFNKEGQEILGTAVVGPTEMFKALLGSE